HRGGRQGPDRSRTGDRPHAHAGRAPRHHSADVPRGFTCSGQYIHLAVQGHLGRFRDRGARAHLWRDPHQRQHLARDRGLSGRRPAVSRRLLCDRRATAPARASLRGDALIELIFSSAPLIARGLLVTLVVSLSVLLLGTLIGLGGGLCLLYGARPLRLAARLYTDTLRGIPQLVLIFAIFYGFPVLGLPLSAILAGILALSLFCGAHVAEVVRGAVAS
ncbi:unnamed protein product, partial [Phaeothamnion confervicola]